MKGMVFDGEETADQSFRAITNWVKCKESYFSFRKIWSSGRDGQCGGLKILR